MIRMHVFDTATMSQLKIIEKTIINWITADLNYLIATTNNTEIGCNSLKCILSLSPNRYKEDVFRFLQQREIFLRTTEVVEYVEAFTEKEAKILVAIAEVNASETLSNYQYNKFPK